MFLKLVKSKKYYLNLNNVFIKDFLFKFGFFFEIRNILSFEFFYFLQILKEFSYSLNSNFIFTNSLNQFRFFLSFLSLDFDRFYFFFIKIYKNLLSKDFFVKVIYSYIYLLETNKYSFFIFLFNYFNFLNKILYFFTNLYKKNLLLLIKTI